MTEQQADKETFDWERTYAYSVGMQAYVFGFPWVYFSELRHQWVVVEHDPETTPYAPLNYFWHARNLINADYTDGGSPNNDTLYSIAWVDLRQGPVVLSVPAVVNRYFTMEIAGMDSDNFAYVGTRTTGEVAGNYAIIGPDWHGTLPDGVAPLPQAHTPFALIVGRTLIDGKLDLDAVRALQDQYLLRPLSLWGTSAEVPIDRDVPKPFSRNDDPLADWKTMNRAMSESPPGHRLDPLLAQFAEVHVGPWQDVELASEATKAGLAQAASDARLMLDHASGALGTTINGWTFPPLTIGRAGAHDDFLVRASPQCMGGIVYNDLEEAVYPYAYRDAEGEPLSGAYRYTLEFSEADLPPVKDGGFWSVTLYANYNLVHNPINRYSIGNRTAGLNWVDGGLTIYIQHDRPTDPVQLRNWLPAPVGTFDLKMRCYLPAPEIFNQVWKPPGLTRQA
ncbi:DUF1254 domain-containing protein [Allorhizocola rhizosphaerae]|uniref:DUF1254 domain-containing protein n=1 Tax=Allorhizocola rhizosphaerae TaxID=1872709 RepID=UPI0013C2E9E0|nr:DUF1254 domain-containing protein [Allorhizocola rhizosphaerae]